MAYKFESDLQIPDEVQIVDANGNELVEVTATTSAVNHVSIVNAITANAPSIRAAGDDANVDLIADGKGTGRLTDASGNNYLISADTGIAMGFTNTGLTIADTDASHDLTVKWNENEATLDRTLNLLLNGADRTVNLSGNLVLAGNLTTSGGHAVTLTTTGITALTLPTTGTLETTGHASKHLSGGSDAIKLDDLAAPDDNTDLNASVSAHGLLPKLSGNAATFLDGTGNYSTPAGGGDVSDGDTLVTGLTFPNAGLHILDTGGTHDLIIAYGEDATADRTLTFDLTNADRRIDLAGDITLAGALTTSGGHGVTLNTTGATSVTLPTSGTLATTAQLHTQNTDTGTTSTTFGLDTGGTEVKLKASGGELQVRNAGDSAYADLRMNNLYVEGTITTINSETVTIDDNIIVLNNNVTGTPSEDAGIEVERGTSANSQVLWDESNDHWALNDGTSTLKAARTFSADVGNAADTQITVTHNLGTEDVIVGVRYAAGTKQGVLVDWRVINSNSIRVDFASAPAASEFRVTVTG